MVLLIQDRITVSYVRGGWVLTLALFTRLTINTQLDVDHSVIVLFRLMPQQSLTTTSSYKSHFTKYFILNLLSSAHLVLRHSLFSSSIQINPTKNTHVQHALTFPFLFSKIFA